MSFGHAVKTCLRKYATFEGRATRSEFWWFWLFQILVMIPVVGVYMVIVFGIFVPAAIRAEERNAGEVAFTDLPWLPFLGGMFLVIVVSLALFLPDLAVTVRRLHDMGQSGWWVVLNFVGLNIVVLVMCLLETQPHSNQWGQVPRVDQ